MPRLKNFVSSILLAFGYSINSKSKKKLLGDLIRLPQGVGLSAVEARKAFKSSKSQLGQDLLALIASGAKEPRFFVEFGSADGVALSNSFLLEKELGWSGILCEPSRSWHEDLKRNRSCIVDTRCVYSRTGEQISFSENYIGELSGITEFTGNDHHGLLDRTTTSYQVETISLLDLLKHHNAPKHIEFLSVDTEGSEFEILNGFDFRAYTFGAICVEHNFGPTRELISSLLTKNGYVQIHADLSEFDDWYIHPTN
jgi:FkbM family methyltransferase